MKILHVAVFTTTSTNVWQADAFERLGHEVIRYDYRAKAVELDGSLGNVNTNRDKNLISLCNDTSPDVILFSKCNQMGVSVVTECNKVGTTVLWYMDPAGNINNELIQKIKEVDYVFSARWDGFNAGKRYNKNTFRIHEGYNSEINVSMNIPKVRNAVFIGNLRQDRLSFCKACGIEVVSSAYNEEHAKAVSETKININFTEGDGTSDRTYKVLASGGFLLTQPWYKMDEEFVIGKDLDIFRSGAELKKKIKYYLDHDEDRNTIAEHGCKTVQKYNDINYAKRILERII